MIRTLITISVVGFLLSIACIAGAIGLAGGPFSIRDRAKGWAVEHTEWGDHKRGRHGITITSDDGETTTRDFTWQGADHLDVSPSADIVYTQGPVAKLTIFGPTEALDNLRVRDGRIDYAGGYDNDDARLKIILTAPDVQAFDLAGSQKLVVESYKQEKLSLDISGDAQVSVKGVATSLRLDITGDGSADLADLTLDSAVVDISGNGQASLGPRESAKIDVSGDGVVKLTAKPRILTQDISGSGQVSQPGLPD
ncbi:MAG: hypothetical protein CFE28_02550 [Alphaproteobacteria bacterium PA2]|nr:MAG: hypothetical protein CFE28_02550 [Alphaproteobacteria bacterium PA2]